MITRSHWREAIQRGQFREDLYFRLNVLALRVPSLRERGPDVELLAKARRSARLKRPGTRFALERLLELSFRAGESAKKPSLRYVVDAAGVRPADRASLVECCLAGVGRTADATCLGELLQGDPEALVYIGAEHGASGAIIRSKTYWGSALAVQRILSVLPPELREAGQASDRAVLSLWPEWRTFRFVGIDFRASGPPRVKLYYPPRDCEGDLPIEMLVELCAALGIPAPVGLCGPAHARGGGAVL